MRDDGHDSHAVSRIGPSLDRLSDEWRYALLGGLLSVPFTTVGYWQTGSEIALSPVLFGGLLVGRVGARIGGWLAMNPGPRRPPTTAR